MPITTDLQSRGQSELGGSKAAVVKAGPREKPKKRVACYCRVSSQLEAQEDSLAVQKTHFVRLAGENPEVSLVGVYCEDGISGTEASNRPEFQRMMRDCRAGRIDEIWVKSISRWARNTLQLLESLRELKALGVNVVFEKERLETAGGHSELMLALIGSFAEFESKSIRQNTKMGYRTRMQAGKYFYKRPPYGYDANENGELVLNAKEAPVVRRIFRMCLDGMGSVRIANALQAEAIPTKRGSVWQSGTIRAILTNITYTGDVLLQKTIRKGNGPRIKNDGSEDQYLVTHHHAAIVDYATFDAARVALRSRARGRAVGDGKSGNRYAFSQKLICAHCGHHLHRCQGKTGIQWICTGHRARGCPMKPVSELEVKNRFKRIVADIDRLLEIHSEWMDDDGPALRLRVNLSQQDALRALQTALSPSEYSHRLNALESEADVLRSQIAGSAGRMIKEMKKACHRVPANANWNQVEPFFMEQVESVTVWSDGRMAFRFMCGVTIVSPECGRTKEQRYAKGGSQCPFK